MRGLNSFCLITAILPRRAGVERAVSIEVDTNTGIANTDPVLTTSVPTITAVGTIADTVDALLDIVVVVVRCTAPGAHAAVVGIGEEVGADSSEATHVVEKA